MTYVFGPHSEKVLATVHPDLVKVVRHALTKSPLDFAVIQGLRTREEELALYQSSRPPNKGPWKTNCNGTAKGETSPEGYPGTGVSNHQEGKAVDLAALYEGVITWAEPSYVLIDKAMQEAADELGIMIKWGGHFPQPDLDHWELDHNVNT